MSVSPGDEDRYVLPRWRTLGRSGDELRSHMTVDRTEAPKGTLEEATAAFSSAPGLYTAGDLVGQAEVKGLSNARVDEARQLLAESGEPWLGATRISGRHMEPALASTSVDIGGRLRAAAAARVRLDRQILAREPRNAIRWTDMALAHTSLGNLSEAQRALRTARSLAPANRYVLRSFARFGALVDDPGEALAALRNSGAMGDPWLLAAELALSDFMGLPTRYYREAKNLHKGPTESFHLSELRAALATMEMRSGAIRTAARLLRDAVSVGTENAIAQAEWARVKGVPVRVPRAAASGALYEAECRRLAASMQLREALGHAKAWLDDQPFAKEPATFVSWLACTEFEDWDLGAEASRQGLVASPGDTLLTNNLVVALCMQGHVEEAAATLASITINTDTDPSLLATVRATHGLVEFRQGRAESGRASYRAAVASLTAERRPDRAALAALYLVREEMRCGSSHVAADWHDARQRAMRSSDPIVARWKDRLQALVDRQGQSGG